VSPNSSSLVSNTVPSDIWMAALLNCAQRPPVGILLDVPRRCTPSATYSFPKSEQTALFFALVFQLLPLLQAMLCLGYLFCFLPTTPRE